MEIVKRTADDKGHSKTNQKVKHWRRREQHDQPGLFERRRLRSPSSVPRVPPAAYQAWKLEPRDRSDVVPSSHCWRLLCLPFTVFSSFSLVVYQYPTNSSANLLILESCLVVFANYEADKVHVLLIADGKFRVNSTWSGCLSFQVCSAHICSFDSRICIRFWTEIGNLVAVCLDDQPCWTDRVARVYASRQCLKFWLFCWGDFVIPLLSTFQFTFRQKLIKPSLFYLKMRWKVVGEGRNNEINQPAE